MLQVPELENRTAEISPPPMWLIHNREAKIHFWLDKKALKKTGLTLRQDTGLSDKTLKSSVLDCSDLVLLCCLFRQLLCLYVIYTCAANYLSSFLIFTIYVDTFHIAVISTCTMYNEI